MCRRTSGNSSLSICRNIGRRCAIVLKCEKVLSMALSEFQRQKKVHSLVLSKNGGKSTDLCAQRGPDMLGAIADQVLNSSHDLIQKSLAVKQPTESYFSLNLSALLTEQWNKLLPGICPATAVRTSASESFKSLTKAGTRSRLTMSSPTAFAS